MGSSMCRFFAVSSIFAGEAAGAWRGWSISDDGTTRARPPPWRAYTTDTLSYTGKTEVAIVGAGYAGLTAAQVLSEAGVEVAVLEARDRVGGRVYTESRGDFWIDHGGQWIGRSQLRLGELARRHGVETFLTYDEGDNLAFRHGNRFTYTGLIPTDQPDVTADAVAALLDLDLMALQVPADAPWDAPEAKEWDSITAHSWFKDNIESAEAQHELELFVEAVFSSQSRDMSLLHFLFYLKSAGGSTPLIAVAGGGQESRFVGGAQQVANRIAAQLGDRVRLNSPVLGVAYHEGGVTITGAGFEVEARRAVIAVPPPLGARINWSPALPIARQQIFQRVPMGCAVKVHAVYDRPFWREEGLSGQFVSQAGPVKFGFDNSPPDGNHGVLLGFMEGDDARTWASASAEDREAETIRAFTEYFGPRASRPEAYTERSWAHEEFSRGCYAGVFGPGVWTTFGSVIREPVQTLHWAGTETATEWMGYIDGAVESGERAAREILVALEVPEGQRPAALPSRYTHPVEA
ncbi:MAG: flavin monoamine oxidase family protein [Candidatus Dormibacteria bacterium]